MKLWMGIIGLNAQLEIQPDMMCTFLKSGLQFPRGRIRMQYFLLCVLSKKFTSIVHLQIF